jgi:DHA2 family multidrug resistance protein-like MFS transporter
MTISVASTAIMGNAPANRAGMAASIEEVSYEFGTLSAVTILGSVVTAVYSATVRLPTGVDEFARDGLAQATTVASNSPEHAEALLQAAGTAYDQAFLTVMMLVTAILLVGAVTTGLLLRHYGPGSQASLHGSSH